MISALQEGIGWCESRGLLTAATVLLVEKDRLLEGKDASVEKRAVDLTPPGFPFGNAFPGSVPGTTTEYAGTRPKWISPVARSTIFVDAPR